MNWTGRIQEIVPLALAARASFRRLRRPSWLGGRDDWVARAPEIELGDRFDLVTAFFAQCAHDHQTIVEIGSSDGRRITALKAIFPNSDACGLDIGSTYKTPFEAFGVKFRQFEMSDDLFPSRALVISVGTLGYMPPKQLNDFISFLARRQCSLAYFEPMPWWSLGAPVRRRINGGWYYPYTEILSAAGFKSVIGKKWSHLASHRTLERWEYDFSKIE